MDKDFRDRTDEEWKEVLDEDTYRVLRGKGTEAPFSGRYHDHKEDGTYVCAGCGTVLFDSRHKFDSGTGWPSFDRAVQGSVTTEEDRSHGMMRTEILCSRCGGHLGHVFRDGPSSTGLRYCTNSASLRFRERPSGRDDAQ